MGQGDHSDPYRRPFEAILDGAVILDAATGRVLLANHAAATMLGFASPDEMVGLNPLDHIPDEDRNFVAMLLAQGLEMDRPTPAEIRVKARDGRPIWVSVTSSVTEHEGKKAALITLREITSEKDKDAALMAADYQYRRLFEIMQDGAVVLDTATSRVVLANQAAASMFGFASPGEITGQNPVDYVPEEDRERTMHLIGDTIERGHLSPSEIRIRDRNRRLLWVSISASIIEYGGRKATLVTVRDITAEKDKDAALREAESRYERLFDGMLDGAVVLDISTFQVAYANRAAAEMFGFASPAEAVGENPLSYIPEEDRDRVAGMIALNLEGKGTNPAEIRVLTRDKRERWVSATATRVEYEGRTATLATLRDMTADRLKDAALQAAEESRLRLMDAAAEAITIVQDGKLVYVNPAVVKGAGIPQEQLIGLPFMDLVHPDEKQAVSERYKRLLAGEWPSDISTIRGVNAKGETLWAEIREIPFTWQGKPAVMSLIHDITDRVQAEEERKEKEERLRTIVENAWDGISIFDENLRVTFESPSIARMTGYTPEEWTGSRPEAFNIHPDDLPSLLTKLEVLKSQPGAVVRDFKVRYRHRDGSWRWIEATGRNLIHDPRMKGIVVNFRDITESVKAEEALKASEERFRTLIEKATDVVIVLDASGKITYQSPSLERVTGFGHNEWLNKPLGELLIHPDDMPYLAATLERILAEPGATLEGITVRYQHKDRSWHTLEATVTNMLHDPKVNGLVANFRDITDRKLAEEGLAQSEQKYRLLVENSTDVIFSVDTQGNFAYVSPAIERVSGYGVEEVVGTSFTNFVVPEDLPGLMASFERTLGGASEPAEFRGRRKDGAVRYVRTTSRLMRRDGQVVGLTGVMSDITEHKTAEDAVKRSEALLRDTEELASVGGWEYNVLTGDMLWTEETYHIHEIPQIPGIDHISESLKCYPPPARQVIEEAFEKCIKEGIPYDLELPFVTFADNQRWVRTTAKAIREGNRIVRVVGNIADITERKQVEQALRSSEERNRLLIDNAAEVVTVVQDGLIKFINRKCMDLAGYSPEELLSKSFIDLIHPDDRQKVADNYVKRLNGEDTPATYEIRVLHKNGVTRWASTSVTLFTWEGRPATMGLLTDITVRRHAEDALRVSEERFRQITENMLDAVSLVDANAIIKYASPSHQRILGYASEDLVGKSVFDFVPPEDVDGLMASLDGILEKGEITYQSRFRHSDGHYVWGEASAKAIRDDSGNVSGYVISGKDITDRKLVQEALKESEAKYKRLFESTQTAMEVISMETGLVVLANEATARMFGFASANDLVGEDSMKYLRPEDVGWVSTKMAKAVADQTWQEIAELQVRTRDGRWLWISGMAIQSEYQGKPALLVSLLDITSRKHAEQTLRESEEKYRLLTEKTNDIIYTTDLDFDDTYVSPSVERILGFTPEEYLGRSPDQRMTLESLAHAQEALLGHLSLEKDRKADPNRTVRIELEFYHKDGSTVWLEHQVSGLRDADGMVIGLHGVARDVTERRKAQKALRDSEAIYKRLFENTQTAMEVVSGETGLVVLANETTARMFGFDSADDLVGVDSMEYLLPEDRDRVATEMAQALMNKDRGGATELSVRTRDGRWLWINALATYTEYEGKTSLLISLIDLTSRKQAEEELKASEEKYRLLAEKTNDVIWTADLNLRTTYVSPSAQRVLGFTPEERLQQDVTQQITPESFDQAADALTHHLALEQDPTADPNRTLRIELEYYRKDGSTVWLENQISGIRDASGKLVGFHGVARDVSERRKAEEALKESEAKYRLVADSTNDEIWTSDINLNTTYVSPSVEKILGFTVEERMKQDVMAQMTPESFARAAEALKYHLALEEDPKADPNRVLRIELEYYRKDGSTIWLENQVSGIRDASGILIGFHGVARDVTERRRTEQALRERLKELQCIAGVSRLAEKPDLPIEEFVREAVGLLPPAWQYPDICGARIQLDSKEFKTANYRDTEWSQSADITVDEKRFGIVTVCYLQEMPGADEGPFLKEERDLINTVADFLGHVIQHRQMERHLRASEERYRLLAQNASDIIWVTDANLKITYVSPSATSLLGYSPEELIAGAFDKLLTPGSLAMVTQAYEDGIGKEESTPGSMKTTTLELEVACKDGSTVWLEAAVTAVRDSKGRFAGFQGACRDITERRRAQEALSASETNYRNLFDHTLLGMEVIDGQTGKTVLANRSLARMFGFKSPADMVGINPLDYVLPEDLEWVANQVAQLMAEPSWDKQAIIRSRTEDGRLIWCTGMATPFEYEGKPTMLISLVDITTAKEAEDKLRESEEKNRLLIEVAAEGIVVVQDGVTKFFNRRLEELTGLPAEELFSRSFLDLVHTDDREMVALNYMKRIGGEEVPNNYQFRIVNKENKTKWVQVSAVRLAWEGKPATLNMFSNVTERVKAEEALRDSEERFRALVEKATDAVAVLDATGNILYYTPSMERVTGYRPGEWVNKSLSDLLLHPDDLPKLASVLEQLLKKPGASVENFTTRYRHRDGTWHVLEATARNMLHDPKINGVVANFRDITERVKAEQALKESEERYRLLAENATDIIWVADLNLRITYVSPAITRLLGYTMEEVADSSFVNKLLTPESLSLMAREFTGDLAAEETGPGSWKPRIVEIEALGRDGLKYWLEAAINGIRDTEGRLIAFQGACRDITDRKKAEELLRNSEERFRGLVETSSDWVWETDRNTRYTYVSPKVHEILGREPEEMLGHTPFEFMHQREGRRVSKIVRRFSTDHLPFSLLENTAIHKDGHSVVLETSAVPIIGSDGRFLGYRGMDRDITERKKVEQELQRSLKRLEKTMESTIEAITTTIETRDPYTTGHQMRVTDLACAIARLMEVPPTQIEGIRVAGLLHDIGKIAIPTEILSKPGKLNEVEYEMIKTHSKVGYNILKKIEFPWPVARAVLQHHERWNGTGYPHGIRGEDILLEARILAVADVVEAMSSHRPYRPTIGIDKALDEITKNSGILYDPAVADACVKAFTQGGFKFASSPLGSAETEAPSASDPVHYLEEQ